MPNFFNFLANKYVLEFVVNKWLQRMNLFIAKVLAKYKCLKTQT